MSILIFILILAVLIIVHEYGHFIVAKKWGIRVDEFGIGYPPRAKTLFKIKGTIFTLNWIPFGGFVKIFGENPDDLPAQTGESLNHDDRGVALTSKSRFAQGTVMFAGPLFNFIFAWFVILVTLFLGLPSAIDSSDSKKNAYVVDSRMVITDVLDGSPAQNAGLLVGDAVASVFDGQNFYGSISEAVGEGAIRENQAIILNINRKGENLEKEVFIDSFNIDGRPAIGVGLQEVGIYKPPFFRALVDSFVVTGNMIYQITFGLGQLIVDAFRGTADVSNLTGPVGIVALVGDASMLGFVYLLTFVALISINLGVINLIPFPALDGGRILFLIIESIKGSRISPKISNALNSIGFLILIVLMIFITFRDIFRLF